ncbi:MAG: hypothetical protein IJK23_12265 [Clostridia bacterium]|nr:hypothetical protein [Clostridia bacterium]
MSVKSPLFDYLPQIFAGVADFQALFGALRSGESTSPGSVDTADADIKQAGYNQFPLSEQIDYTGAIRWANALRVYSPGKTREELLFSVRSLLEERRPYNLSELKRMLNKLVGPEGESYSLTVDVPGRRITVKLALAGASAYNDTVKLLQRIIPAQLILNVQIMYNRYSAYVGMTHGEMHGKTHQKLRSGNLYEQ